LFGRVGPQDALRFAELSLGETNETLALVKRAQCAPSRR
jgi:hypothetical protein